MRKARKAKYNARKVTGPNGQVYDSKMELDYYKEVLVPALVTKKIHALHRQTVVDLVPTKGAKISMIPDYDYMEDGVRVYVDVKGMETPVFKLKAKLWKTFGPGPLMIIKKVKGEFVLDREIIPLLRGKEE
jgi:hypothetical protein